MHLFNVPIITTIITYYFVFLGNDNEDLVEVFKDSNIIQLLNNELIICFKMDPTSSSFTKFKEICILL